MQNRNTKFEFVALLIFLTATALLLTNGFVGRISAEEEQVDVYSKLEPVGDVPATILQEYVREVDIDRVVEGALIGMMGSLDRHSSFIPAEDLQSMKEDTRGEFEGIGVSIKTDDDKNIMVYSPISGSPAAKAGLRPFDLIIKIDGLSTLGMTLGDAADKIRGPRGTTVKLTILRKEGKDGESEELEFQVKRAKVPLESIKESRLLDKGIAYIRISDFKDNTAKDLKDRMQQYLNEGMQAMVLDLRWNPGGLLTASREVCELFLEKGSLVTYTKGRESEGGGPNKDDMQLYTERKPVLPSTLPVILLVNEQTASSSEIVTGALQFYKRALVVGEKTFGKGSVQTIIPLRNPKETALRLTTALYYTPADVTIDHHGILPDVDVPMTMEEEQALGVQMYKSFENDPAFMNRQNHGSVTGNEMGEDSVEDLQLQKAVSLLAEEAVWDKLLNTYHKDVSLTQVAADKETISGLSDVERSLLENHENGKINGEAAPEEKEEAEEADQPEKESTED